MANAVIYCNRCGAQNSASARFCGNCGTAFSTELQPPVVATAPAEITPQTQTPVWQPSSATYTAPGLAVRYAGFWMRFVAFVIDAVLVGIVVWPISLIMGAVIGFSGAAVAMPTLGIHLVNGLVSLAFSSLANWLYEALMESSSKQATVGKMVLALKVTDVEGRRISFARATGRHFAKVLSGMTLLIGYIMAGFTARKQALHDVIAGTLVIRTQ